MRLDPKLVHSSIFRASKEIFYVADVAEQDSEASLNHQSQWMKEHGWGFVAGVLGLLIVMIPLMHFASGQPKSIKAMIVLATMGTAFAAVVVSALNNQRKMSLGKLEALLPLVKLTETQRAYGQTVVALGKAGQPQFEIEETMRTLNSLLDEEAHLLDTRTRLAGSDDRDERTNLLAEREALAAKARLTSDESARAAFEQSVSLLDDRIASRGDQVTSLERIDAHLELLRQAVLATRDAARHLTGGSINSTSDLSTDALRSAVSLARAQTQATERALAELRSI